MISFLFGRNKITPGIRVEDELPRGKLGGKREKLGGQKQNQQI